VAPPYEAHARTSSLSGQFPVAPVDLATIERIENNLMEPNVAACGFDMIPNSLLSDGAIFGKPVAAIV